MKRVTLKQIAETAKVHISTVSLALRNDPRLPAETRQRLQSLATKMGYVPDAAMSALCAYRNSVRPHKIQSGLAYLTNELEDKDTLSSLVYQHAKRQAERLGYNLIHYSLREKGSSLKRFQSIWWNSGIRGVLIGPFSSSETVLEGDWSRWATVAYGYSVTSPHFNRAVFDHFQNMLLHLGALREKGYKRIGLCLSQQTSSKTQGMLHAAYLLDQALQGKKKPIPILWENSRDGKTLENWILKERLDAIISYVDEYHLLLQRGWKIPAELGLSLLSTWALDQKDRKNQIAGFDSQAEALAASAISFLVSLIHEQAYGLSHPARAHMVSGEFREGITLRKASTTRPS